ITPGRATSTDPFRLIIEGCNSNDQVFLDPNIGVRVVMHGGPEVKRLKMTGNGSYNVTYTPDAPAVDPTMEHFIPEGLLREASGVMRITGSFGVTDLVVDNFNPANGSAVRLDNFNQVMYKSPGFLETTLNVTVPRDDEWQIEGRIANDI